MNIIEWIWLISLAVIVWLTYSAQEGTTFVEGLLVALCAPVLAIFMCIIYVVGLFMGGHKEGKKALRVFTGWTK